MTVTVNIYNSTSSRLKIEVENIPAEANIPTVNRVNVFSNLSTKYPKITISDLNHEDQVIRHVWFYTWNDYSWIVRENYIHRQKQGDSLHVAEPCSDFETETHFKSFTNYKWEYCNQIKRYEWIPGSGTEMVVYDNSNYFPANDEDRITRYFNFFAEAVHLSGFSPMNAKQRGVVSDILQWISVSRLLVRTQPGTIITVETLSNQGYIYANTGNLNLRSFRLDFQGMDSSHRGFRRFAIQYENQTFGQIHLPPDIGTSNEDDEAVRAAFRRSLEDGVDIYVTNDGNPPPGRNTNFENVAIICSSIYWFWIKGK